MSNTTFYQCAVVSAVLLIAWGFGVGTLYGWFANEIESRRPRKRKATP